MLAAMQQRTDHAATTGASGFGALLKEWRRTRGVSQLDLAVECDVSQRHVSFIESGRSTPSRGMILHLAAALAIPLREQNAMLLAAGYAPAFGERELGEPDMEPVSRALDQALRQQEPFPAVVVDATYTVLHANRAASTLMAFLFDGPPPQDGEGAGNLMDMLIRPDGLRPMLEDWERTLTWMLRRVRSEYLMEGQPEEIGTLFERLRRYPDGERLLSAPRDDREMPVTLNVVFRKGETRLSLFTMIATMGTPMDVSLQNIRLEYFFPTDAATEAWFRAHAES